MENYHSLRELTSCSVTSKDVIVVFRIDTNAGEVYADENPTTIDPIDTAIAARICGKVITSNNTSSLQRFCIACDVVHFAFGSSAGTNENDTCVSARIRIFTMMLSYVSRMILKTKATTSTNNL
jgi:hypothetical protein